MALGKNKRLPQGKTRAWGIASRVKVPAAVADDFRAACDMAGMPYKKAFAGLCGHNNGLGVRKWHAALRVLVANGVDAAEQDNFPACDTEMRLHIPEDCHAALLAAAALVRPGLDLTSAGSAVLVGFSVAGTMHSAVAALAGKPGAV